MSDTNELRAVKLTARQIELLRDLVALEDAGMISKGGSLDVFESVYCGTACNTVDVEPVVTYAARPFLSTSDARAPSVEEGKHGG